tara:strand:- start:2903 stop:3481 length:579 start_codon:yes stop_codon:yes gene_type:complete
MIKPDLTVTSKQLSDILDLSVRRIQQLAKSGTLPQQEARNRYRLVDSIQGYIKYLRGQVVHGDAPQDLREAKLRQEKARAEILELEALQKNGELQHQDDIQKVWTSIAVLIKTKLLALSSRVSADVYGATSLVQVRTRIDEEVDLILNELVNTQVELDATSTDRVSTDNSTRDIKEFETSAKDDGERVGGSK